MTNEVDELLKERERFLTRIREAARRAVVESEKLAAPDHEDLLLRYVARLQEATRAKQEAIARHDEEIQHYTELIGEVKEKLSAKPPERPEAPPTKPSVAAATMPNKSNVRKKATKKKGGATPA